MNYSMAASKRLIKNKKLLTILLVVALIALFFIAINSGSIKVTPMELFKGLFVEYDRNVASIVDLRFPRVFIAMFAGASLAVAGVILQAVLRNPLADPSIIGISSGASLATVIVASLFPGMYFQIPIFAFIGGLITSVILYLLSWKSGMKPLRVILTGIAVNAVCTALIELFSGSGQSGVASIVEANITLKTWNDVNMIVFYSCIGLVLSLFSVKACDLMALEDKTIRSLGVQVNKIRIFLMFISVLLASISTAIVGVISFLGLIAPHIARLCVGSNHKHLIPFSMLLGAFLLLLADTVGRLIMPPYEISAAILMSLVGGPLFIILLKKSDDVYGK